MPEGKLMTMTPEAAQEVASNLDQMKKILDNKDAMLATGLLTADQLKEVQTVYDTSIKLYNLYKPDLVPAKTK